MVESEIIYCRQTKDYDNKLFVREEDFEFPHGEDYKFAIEKMEKIQTTLFSGEKIFQLFDFNDISLWWFIYQSLIPQIKKNINFIIKFTEFLEQTRPKTVTIKDDFTKVDLIIQICKKNSINVKYSKNEYLKFKMKRMSKNIIQKKRFSKIAEIKKTNRKECFLKEKNIIPKIDEKIIFAIPTIYRRKIFDLENSKTKNGEYILNSIFRLFENDKIIGLDIDYTFKGNTDVLEDRLSDEISWFPIEMITSNKESNEGKIFLQKIEQIFKNNKFQQLFEFQNISFWKNIENFFTEILYEPNLPTYIKIIEGLEVFLKNKSPKAFFLPYETGPIALAIIAVCKKLNIKTFGVQHGYIYQKNPMYIFGRYTFEKIKLGFPIPNHFLLFGEYDKEILTKNEYPKDRLIEFGNPAYFNHKQIIEKCNSRNFRRKYNINPGKKIVLFTTGKLQRNYPSHGKYDYDEQIWRELLVNFKDQNVHIILKPHPQEKNVQVYEEIKNEINIKNADIIDDDIYELINAASVVISVFSSTMLDAMVFQKPVIKVQFENEQNSIFKNNEGILICNLKNLNQTIKKITESDIFNSNVIANSAELLKKHYGIPEKNPIQILEKLF